MDKVGVGGNTLKTAKQAGNPLDLHRLSVVLDTATCVRSTSDLITQETL